MAEQFEDNKLLSEFRSELSILADKKGKLSTTLDGKYYWLDSDFSHFEKDLREEFYAGELKLRNWIFPEEQLWIENFRKYQERMQYYYQRAADIIWNNNKLSPSFKANLERFFIYKDIKPEFNTVQKIILCLNVIIKTFEQVKKSFYIFIDETEEIYQRDKNLIYETFRDFLKSCQIYFFTAFDKEIHLDNNMYIAMCDIKRVSVDTFRYFFLEKIPTICSTVDILNQNGQNNFDQINGKKILKCKVDKKDFFTYF